MLPLRDVIPSRTRPWVTLAIIAVILLVFVWEWLLSQRTRAEWLLAGGLIPAQASWLTATTSLFLHANSLQAAGNLGALWIFGENVEDRLGHIRYLIFFLLAGYGGALALVWAAPASAAPALGAGGAVGGVIAAYMVLFPQSRVLVLVPLVRGLDLVEVPATLFLAVWLFTQLFGGFGRLGPPMAPALTLAAPAGGVLAGFVLVWIFRRPERLRVDWWDRG